MTPYRFGKCKTCKGTGLAGDELCDACHGAGERAWTQDEIKAADDANKALADGTRRMLEALHRRLR